MKPRCEDCKFYDFNAIGIPKKEQWHCKFGFAPYKNKRRSCQDEAKQEWNKLVLNKTRFLPVGAVFSYEGKDYTIVEGKGCRGCAFNSCVLCLPVTIPCNPCEREDKKAVIFKEVTK